MGDFDDLCLFWMHEKSHLSRNLLDFAAQFFEVCFAWVQDDPVVHVHIVAVQVLDGLAVGIDACRKEYPGNLREWRADAEGFRQEFLSCQLFPRYVVVRERVERLAHDFRDAARVVGYVRPIALQDVPQDGLQLFVRYFHGDHREQFPMLDVVEVFAKVQLERVALHTVSAVVPVQMLLEAAARKRDAFPLEARAVVIDQVAREDGNE